jgi:hypothetical protein
MFEINICNSKGRDAVVALESVTSTQKVRWVDSQNRQVSTVRLLKGPVEHDIDALRSRFGELPQVGQALVDSDPEIDFENTGRFLTDTSRVYITPDRQVVHKVQFWEIVRNPDGSVRERRPRKIAETNLAGDQALRWSGTFIPREQAIRKFVFSSKVMLHHTNGLTYDFLFKMAQELEAKDSLMLLGAGPKSNQPLIVRRGGSPYRGFLEGRTRNDQYALVLHFSDMELKAPAPSAPPAAGTNTNE